MEQVNIRKLISYRLPSELTDASSHSAGAIVLEFESNIFHYHWETHESPESSTWRELAHRLSKRTTYNTLRQHKNGVTRIDNGHIQTVR